MKNAIKSLILSLLFVGATAVASTPPINIITLAPPSPVKVTDGSHVLVYELQIRNTSGETITPTDISIYNAQTATLLLRYWGDDFSDKTGILTNISDDPISSIKNNRRAYAFLWVRIPPGQPIPSSLTTKVTFANHGEIYVGPTKVKQKPIVAINAPVQGTWFLGTGMSNAANDDHRRSIIRELGGPLLSERYALDLVMIKRVDKNKYIACEPEVGDKCSTNAQWFSFGQPVYAVADGIVTARQTGIRDNRPCLSCNYDNKPANMRMGNYIITSVNNTKSSGATPGNYATYAHLKYNSITVHLGDVVHQGEIIGYVGNSGNSAVPHLHFQLNSPGAHPMLAHGVPFLFKSFYYLGNLDSGMAATESLHTNELPLYHDFFRFPYELRQ